MGIPGPAVPLQGAAGVGSVALRVSVERMVRQLGHFQHQCRQAPLGRELLHLGGHLALLVGLIVLSPKISSRAGAAAAGGAAEGQRPAHEGGGNE